ncbi:hypothetical protein [Magnetococcus sp. PR-3]|uniref:hypothetical protein n=1 Tax=Magnetococcus sp. PR-3 TaxID=3120355 RepID=UPI002FCDEAE9
MKSHKQPWFTWAVLLIPVLFMSACATTPPVTNSKNLLNTCNVYLASNRLSLPETPQGETPKNAMDCYQAVLHQDPGNSDAAKGLWKVEKRYARRIETALRTNNRSQAKKDLKRLRVVNPESSFIPKLERKITPRSKTTTRRTVKPAKKQLETNRADIAAQWRKQIRERYKSKPSKQLKKSRSNKPKLIRPTLNKGKEFEI